MTKNYLPYNKRPARVIDINKEEYLDSTIAQFDDSSLINKNPILNTEEVEDKKNRSTYSNYFSGKIMNRYYLRYLPEQGEKGFYLLKKSLLEKRSAFFFIFEIQDILAALVITEAYYPLADTSGTLLPFQLEKYLQHNKFLVNIIDEIEETPVDVHSSNTPYGYGLTRLKNTDAYTDTALMNTFYPFFNECLNKLTQLLSSTSNELKNGKLLLYLTHYYNSILEELMLNGGQNFLKNIKDGVSADVDDKVQKFKLDDEQNLTLDEQIVKFITIENLHGFLYLDAITDIDKEIDFNENRKDKSSAAVTLSKKRFTDFEHIKEDPINFLLNFMKKRPYYEKSESPSFKEHLQFEELIDFKNEQKELIAKLSAPTTSDSDKDILAKKFLILFDKKLSECQIDAPRQKELQQSISTGSITNQLTLSDTMGLPDRVGQMRMDEKEAFSILFKDSRIQKKEKELTILNQKIQRVRKELDELKKEEPISLLTKSVENINKAKKEMDTQSTNPNIKALVRSVEELVLDNSTH
ncbi:MAG: hypothetical protein RR470_10640 [Vagococcus sp.]|uniref:hypothetical protein n=1 Tax=Vagococcus sp. TaxID=1933889 RepID=UPI002FC7B34E